MPRAKRRAGEWRWLRAVLRAIIGLACLYAQLLSPARLLSPVTIFAGVFAAFGIACLISKRVDRLQSALATLFVETIFFVVYSVYGADAGGWMASTLYMYVVLSAVLHYDWGDVFIVVGACLAFFAFVHPPSADVLRRVVLVAGLLGCVFGCQKRALQRGMEASLTREKALHDEADKIREMERVRIAGDFHDGPLQSFISLQVRLDILGTLMKRDRAAAAEDLKELQDLARQQVAEIRSFLRSMRPIEVDASDPVSSARRIVEYFQKDTGVASRFVCTDTAVKMAPEISHELLQILREALHNVQKHSKASRVVVSLEQSGKTVELGIDDDGTGFSFAGSFSLEELDLLRLGPQSIKRRVRSLGGDLLVESRPGHGAGLKVRVPG